MLESRIKLDIETLTMKLNLIFALLLLSSLPITAEEVADPCLKAADYKGCKEYQQQQAPGKVNVDTPNDHEYDPKSVRQQKIRGRYGRYITFTGITLNEYDGSPGRWNPGQPGRRECKTVYGFNNTSKTTTCQQVGYVAPSFTPATPGGVERKRFRYQLDCQDMTFDRKGDFSGWGNKGWLNVSEDPTAETVAERYCPVIDTLDKQNIVEDSEE